MKMVKEMNKEYINLVMKINMKENRKMAKYIES